MLASIGFLFNLLVQLPLVAAVSKGDGEGQLGKVRGSLRGCSRLYTWSPMSELLKVTRAVQAVLAQQRTAVLSCSTSIAAVPADGRVKVCVLCAAGCSSMAPHPLSASWTSFCRCESNCP